MSRGAFPAALLVAFLVVAVVSAVRPTSYFNWLSETFPAWVGCALLVATRRRFPFTPLAYSLMFVFCVVLFTGGHYTYAAVPLGEWMKGWFGFERNHFDRVGHFLSVVKDFNSDKSDTAFVRYSNRWRLERAEPYDSKRPERLSPPKKKIIYWIEKSVPVEYQSTPSRTITSPLRGQLTESLAQPPPAATHTTRGQS